ncbi:hypothetical protein SmJEL517_g02094 [Synchytrium microbalum]|uniref:Thioredoxin domain-containing protein n=1 Tax=Synchytrium microbalum TaxID=1806994 RepID=A0A507CD51_9FUNG|nr:uncharacterized protein SmJEL517_g02094 [Synchytrium microbalum]TPX35485.1 hypothetical protein SmJEL517_g02094 [Synchytrium microbalum]
MIISWRSSILSLLLAVLASNCQADTRQEIEIAFNEAEKSIAFLDAGNFTEVTSNGLYLLFMGAKWCRHCQVLTPKWLVLQQKAADLEEDDIHVRKLECTSRENEDFCANKMKIQAYPTIRLFFKGSAVQDYSGPPETDALYAFLMEKANQFIPNQKRQQPVIAVEEDKGQNAVKDVKVVSEVDNTNLGVESAIIQIQNVLDLHRSSSSPDANPNGEIAHMTSATFNEIVKSGPAFVMFHAPWCGHCKKLAPVWEAFADSMKNKLNVAKVDCTVESVLCKKQGVMGYPTLKYFGGGEVLEYSGGRTLSALQDYVENSMTATSVHPVKYNEVKGLLKMDEIAFYFVYDYRSPPYNGQELMLGVQKLRGDVKIYVCPDIRALTVLGVTRHNPSDPLLVVAKDYGSEMEAYDSTWSVGSVIEWIKAKRVPLVIELDHTTSNDILASGKMVVMGCMIQSDPESADLMKAMRDIAKSWNRYVAEVGLTVSRPIVFVWLDGARWAAYLSRTYALDSRNLPRLLIVDTKSEMYYETQSKGKLLEFEGQSTTTALSEILAGKLSGKSSGGYFGWFMKTIIYIFSPLGMMILNHPILMTIFGVALILSIIYLVFTGDHDVIRDPKAE